MKTLLLNPPTEDDKRFIREGRCTQEQGIWATLWPPVSLATAAAVLRGDGREVKLLDCPADGIDMAGLKARLEEFKPELVVWSTGTPSIGSDLRMAARIKEWAPKAVTAVFGTHVTELDQACMEKSPGLDVILRNEPEYSARDVARSIDKREGFEKIEGITFRLGRDIRRNPDRPFIQDLDELPMPAWDLVNTDSYRLPLKGDKFLMVAPLRGCPYSCAFCTAPTFYGHKLRKRSVAVVVDEIETNIKRYGVDHFFFWADTFVLDQAYVKSLCEEIIKRGLRVSWTSNSRADTVSPELLKLMAKAGCWMLSFGIESSDQKILDLAQKRLKVEQVPRAVQWAHDAGLLVAGHFILGLPGDTMESIEKTAEWAKEIGVDFAQFYCAVPYPGAPLYKTAVKEGWIKKEDFDRFNQEYSVMGWEGVSPQAVMEARDRAHKEFYMRPRAFWTALKSAKLSDPTWLVTSLKRFLAGHFEG